jgi:predicted tellurium resistance membrane protein TerC
MNFLSDPQVWISLLTLTILEVVLGIDNIVFISILAGKLPKADQGRARRLGLVIAMITRVLLLLAIGIILKLDQPLFTIPGLGLVEGSNAERGALSVKELVLLGGGLFLMAKATHEIHGKLEGEEGELSARVIPAFSAVMVQMFFLNIVFSIDSVVTAIGMAKLVEVMIAAVVLSSVFMLWFSKPVANFVEKHPTVKMLALSFLILIGVNLVADGFEVHIPKGYTYFAMSFAFLVEMLNLRLRKHATPVHLHSSVCEEPPKP